MLAQVILYTYVPLLSLGFDFQLNMNLQMEMLLLSNKNLSIKVERNLLLLYYIADYQYIKFNFSCMFYEH